MSRYPAKFKPSHFRHMSRKWSCSALLLLFAASSESAYAVDCTPADIHISSQSDADNFQSNHGPGCDTVTGQLSIGENGSLSTVQNLDGLIDLEAIQGGLRIHSATSLDDIDGLANVSTINSHIIITSSHDLTSLAGLASLTGFTGRLYLDYNEGLQDLGAFTHGATMDEVTIQSCFNLANIDPLAGITSVNGPVFFSQTDIANLDVFSDLTTVDGLEKPGHPRLNKMPSQRNPHHLIRHMSRERQGHPPLGKDIPAV